jgi:hypothetical protein
MNGEKAPTSKESITGFVGCGVVPRRVPGIAIDINKKDMMHRMSLL